jgi:hypothetical protein
LINTALLLGPDLPYGAMAKIYDFAQHGPTAT